MEQLDHLRKILLLEPRGYPCQNVNFVFQSLKYQDERVSGSDGGSIENNTGIQYVIGEQNKIYPLMSGHNTICVATALLECGIIKITEPISQFTIESPAGPIDITASCSRGKTTSILLKNTPSFVEKLDVIVNVPQGVGPVKVDIAYGGMWYAVVDVKQFLTNPALKHNHIELKESCASQLCKIGEMIKVACREQFPVQHPVVDYPGVDIMVWRDEENSRNTVVMSNNKLDWNKPDTWTGMLDRSPCGTGTCAVMSVLHARGKLKVGESFVHESIIGTRFTGTILKELSVAGRPAILPQIEGSAYITQYSEVVVDSQDPFPEGFQVKDIW